MSDSARSGLLIGGAVLATAALVLSYLAAGGASYEPEQVRDPCDPRPWRSPEGVTELAEQFSLSALDGAACELRVSREVLARGLATRKSRESFARRYGIGDAELETAVRAGLERAIGDAERADALDPVTAAVLREAARRVPVNEAISFARDARPYIADALALLGEAGGVLDDALELLP